MIGESLSTPLTVIGGAADDLIALPSFRDSSTGELVGFAADDTVDAGAGDDQVQTGFGNDTITLGAGADAFALSNFVVDDGAAGPVVIGDGVDVITDFNPAEDVVWLLTEDSQYLDPTSFLSATPEGTVFTYAEQDGALLFAGVTPDEIDGTNLFVFDEIPAPTG